MHDSPLVSARSEHRWENDYPTRAIDFLFLNRLLQVGAFSPYTVRFTRKYPDKA